MQEAVPGIAVIDTALGGMPEVMAAYLVSGERPALVDPGPRTSAAAVREALDAAGLGPEDLAWIVLTHVHLDHCGATGILASAFPRAQVVVHRRGARHIAEPARLVAATAEVHGPRWALYGGLDRTDPERIVAAEDGHRVDLGGGEGLVMLEALGHARHHMAVLHEPSGAVMAGDALGVRFPGAGMFPTLPPPDIDLRAGDATLRRLEDLGPPAVLIAHYGPVGPPDEALGRAREQLRLCDEAAVAATASGDLAAEIARRLPLEDTVGDASAVARWRSLAWADQTVMGVAGWMDRRAEEAA